MKLLRFDSIGGASGDMVLACLAGLGADLKAISRTLSALSIARRIEIELERVDEAGIRGGRIRVQVEEPRENGQRTIGDLMRLLEGGGLPDRAKSLCRMVWDRLAEAESKVHKVRQSEVHFHEVSCIDSVVDVAGACLALDMLGVEAVQVGPLPLGSGMVSAMHGVLPVPVPAVVELLRGHPVLPTDECGELVTPTGAALLMAWKAGLSGSAAHGDGPLAIAGGPAYGFGTRKLAGRPNVLRALLFEMAAPSAGVDSDVCLVLECNVDDTVPELLGALAGRLATSGALDVFMTPVQMKKQRPGTLVTVLCRPSDRDRLIDAIFAESTTFGIREQLMHRTVLARRHVDVATEYGTVRVKVGTWRGRDVTFSPEYDDCEKIAAERGVSVRSVYEAATRAVRRT